MILASTTATLCLSYPVSSSLVEMKMKTKPLLPAPNAAPCKGRRMTARVVAKGLGRGGSSVLERPTFDQSQFDPSTQVLEGGDMGRLRHKKGTGSGDSYKVLLVDDAKHTEKIVAKVLPQAVPLVTPDDAAKLFHKSREDGVAVVIVTVKV